MDMNEVSMPQAMPEQQQLFELSEYTVKTVSRLDELKRQQKEAQDMVKSTLAQNEVYKINAENAQEAQKSKRIVENQLQQAPELKALVQKVKDIRQEIKDAKETQSLYALTYAERSGSNVIELPDGTAYEIVKVAKLAKRVQ